MTTPSRARGAALSAAAVLAVTLTACTADDGGAPGSAIGSSASTPASPTAAAPAADQPFGTGCAVPADGPAGFAGMAGAPVVTALGANPVFSALVGSVTAANLVDSLNSQPEVTVLAPADAAFQALPADQLNALLADVPRLTAVLTHHVVSGRLTPAELAGQHTTVDNDTVTVEGANDTVTVEGAGETFTVPGDQTLSGQPATVVCGNVQTANATVYVIDQVLKPQNAG